MRAAHRTLVILPLYLLLASAGIPLPVVDGLLLSEVYPTPAPGAPGEGEWVELENRSSGWLDLEGWCIGDDADPADPLHPWDPGGPTRIPPGGLAIVLEPGSRPQGLGLPSGTLLLRPGDASIGNGLRGEGDRVVLTDPQGSVRDVAAWESGPPAGVSLERAVLPDRGTVWLRSLDPSGSTPGRVNSRIPLPGDVRLRWSPPDRGATGQSMSLTIRVQDRGGAGLPALVVRGLLEEPGSPGMSDLGRLVIPAVGPGDSVSAAWVWTPARGGTYRCIATLEGPVRPRPWDDADTLSVEVAHAPMSRVLTEAMVRPPAGGSEWLEFGDRVGEGAWDGWSIRAGSAAPGSAARVLRLTDGIGTVLLVGSGEDPPAAAPPGVLWRSWPGLRLADDGCRVVLLDPTGTGVDSCLLRPLAGLPRGRSHQRWYPDLPGWVPEAWGVARDPADVTPGRLDAVSAPGSGGGFSVAVSHPGTGQVTVRWSAPARRIRLGLRIYGLSGRPAGDLLPSSVMPGSGEIHWRPSIGAPRLPPGIYLLVAEAVDLDSDARWVCRLALGVRP